MRSQRTSQRRERQRRKRQRRKRQGATAGQLARVAIEEAQESDLLERADDAAGDLFRRPAAILEPEGHLVEQRPGRPGQLIERILDKLDGQIGDSCLPASD